MTNQLENTYQDNPLAPTTVETPSAKKFQMPTDPRFKILFILAIIIVVLIILSLVSVMIRKKPTVTYQPTPTSTILPSPTPTSAIAIPANLQFKLDQISKLSQTSDTVDVPQIDTNVGIIDTNN